MYYDPNFIIDIKSGNAYSAQFVWLKLAVYVQCLVEYVMGDLDSVVEYI